MKKILILISLFVFTSSVTGQNVFAKKVLRRGKVGVRTTVSGRSVPTTVKFRSDRRAINVSFTGLNNFSNVSYTFSYKTRGITQGSTGSVPTNTASATREFLFGTCSAGVCKYDSGITDAKFTVVSVSGSKKYSKTFRLKLRGL